MNQVLAGLLLTASLVTGATADTFGDPFAIPTEQREAATQMLETRRVNAKAQREGSPNAVWTAFGRRDDTARSPDR